MSKSKQTATIPKEDRQSGNQWFQDAQRVSLGKCQMNDIGGDMRNAPSVVVVINETRGSRSSNSMSAHRSNSPSPSPIPIGRLTIEGKEPDLATNGHSDVTSDPPHMGAKMINGDRENADKEDVSMTDISAPGILQDSQMTTNIIAEMYSRVMFMYKMGYPLYVPEPTLYLPTEYRKKGIRVGDVGRVTQDGAFDFLFNICLPPDDPANPRVLPDKFEMLDSIEILAHECFQQEALLSSKGVDLTNDVPMKFECSASEGALLVLPEGATLFEAQDRRSFRDYASRHAQNWYNYMIGHRGRDSPNGSVYIVTGCVKSRNWGIATFHGHSARNKHLNYVHLTLSEESGNILTPRWRKMGSTIVKTGPKSKDLIIAEGQEPNQCTFLRGYKIMLRQDLWDETCSIAVRSHDGNSSVARKDNKTSNHPAHNTSSNQSLYQCEGSGSAGSSTQREADHVEQGGPYSTGQDGSNSRIGHLEAIAQEVLLEADFSTASPLHPSDFINAMLLRLEPKAKVALTHDSDWNDLLPEGFSENVSNLKVGQLLENVSALYSTVVDQYGCVSLISKLTKGSERSQLTQKAYIEPIKEDDGSGGCAPTLRNPTACQYCRIHELECEPRNDNVCDNCRARDKQCIFLTVAHEEALKAAGYSNLDNYTPEALYYLLRRPFQDGRLSYIDEPANTSNQVPITSFTYPPPAVTQAQQTARLIKSPLVRLRSSSPLSLSDILNQDVLQSDVATADVSVAADDSFVETSSGPAARELKRYFDQLYGVSPSVRSPYAITAFVNQHGKQMYRVGDRELLAPAATAQEVENRLFEAHPHAKLNDSTSPSRSKWRPRMSMHHLLSPNVFSKAAPTPLANSHVWSHPSDGPGDGPLSQSMFLNRGSLGTLPISDMFAQVMRWEAPSNPGGGGYSDSGYERSFVDTHGSSQEQRERTFVKDPFGAGVVFDPLVRPSLRIKHNDSEGSTGSSQNSRGDPRPVSKDPMLTQRSAGSATSEDSPETSELHYLSRLSVPRAKMLREMQSSESTTTARYIDIFPATTQGTPIATTSQGPWNHDLVEGYIVDLKLKMPPPAASVAKGGNLGDLELLEPPEADSLSSNDAETDTRTASRPATPVITSTSALDVTPENISTTSVTVTAIDDVPPASDQSLTHVTLDNEMEQDLTNIIKEKGCTTIPGSDSTPDYGSSAITNEHLADHETPSSLTEDGIGSNSHYALGIFDVLQSYTGLPLLDQLPDKSGKRSAANYKRGSRAGLERGQSVKDDMVESDDGDDGLTVETTVIRLPTTKEETFAPRDDPRFVIWGWVNDVTRDQKRDSDYEGSGKKSRPFLGSRRTKKDKGKGRAVANEFGVVTEPREDVYDNQDASGRKYMGDNSIQDPASVGRKKVLIAATIERWVAQLTSEIDYDELLVFFLTYRTYVSATDLCQLLISRFDWALRGDENREGAKIRDERVWRFVRLRTFIVIRYWLTVFWPVDFVPNRELRIMLADCLNQLNKDPLLQKRADGLTIVRRLIRIARERKQAVLAKPEGQSPESSWRGQSSPALNEDDSDVDLDFLPDDQGPSSFGHSSFKYGRGGELLRTTGAISSGFVMGHMPVTTQRPSGTRDLHRSSRSEHVHHQRTLSRVVQTFGNRLRRALNLAAPLVPNIAAPVSTVPNLTNELSAFEVEMSGERSSASICGSVDGYGSAMKNEDGRFVATARQAEVKSGLSATMALEPAQRVAQSQEINVLPRALLPLSHSSLSMSISGLASSSLHTSLIEGRSRSSKRVSTVMRTGQLVKPESSPERPLVESQKDVVPELTAIAAASSNVNQGLTSLSKKSGLEVSDGIDDRQGVLSEAECSKVEGESEAINSGMEVDTGVDVEDITGTEAETSGRAESMGFASANFFGDPLTTSREPLPPPFNAKPPRPFNAVSIDVDDLDLSDASSGMGSSVLPGLLKPTRKWHKRPLFWTRESVSSMGIISHESMALVPSSSSASSLTAGLGDKIMPWGLQDLLGSLRADEEEGVGVDAALKRLEGYIDPQKQEEKIKNINEWIMTIQKRLETGDYNADEPRYSHPGYEEELVEFEKTYHRKSISVDDRATLISVGSATIVEHEPEFPSNIVPTSNAPSNRPVLPQVSPALSSPRAPDVRYTHEDVVPLQSRATAFLSPPPVISSFNSPPLPRLRQSFVISYRAETLAQHFAMIDSELFTCIRFEDLVSTDWTTYQELNILDWNQYLRDRARWKAEQRFPEKTNTVAVVRARFNIITNFVISEVILAPPSTRVLVFKKFLTIAYKSYSINNFHALTAIVTGLSNGLVYKALGRYWSRISHQERRMFTNFQKLINNMDDFKIMRNLIDSIAQSKPLDDSSHAASVVSGSTESKHKNDQNAAAPFCIPFIGVYLSQLCRLSHLNDLIDPTAPNLVVEIDPNTGICRPPRYPDVFSALAPLPPFIQLEPLINVHKQRQISAVIRSLITGQQLARRVHFDTNKKLFHKCLRLRASDINVLRHVLDKYPD